MQSDIDSLDLGERSNLDIALTVSDCMEVELVWLSRDSTVEGNNAVLAIVELSILQCIGISECDLEFWVEAVLVETRNPVHSAMTGTEHP